MMSTETLNTSTSITIEPPNDGHVHILRMDEREIILVNFGETTLDDKQVAVDWAAQYGLHPEPPSEVVAINKRRPELRKELGMGAIALFFPKEHPCGSEQDEGYAIQYDEEYYYLYWWGSGKCPDQCWFFFFRQ